MTLINTTESTPLTRSEMAAMMAKIASPTSADAERIYNLGKLSAEQALAIYKERFFGDLDGFALDYPSAVRFLKLSDLHADDFSGWNQGYAANGFPLDDMEDEF